jgi:hypothetical protein
MKTNNNPYKIYWAWVILFLIFCVAIPFISHDHNGGEQLGLTLLGHGLNYFVEGLFLISIFTSFLYRSWFKKKWHVNALIFFITGGIITLTIVLNNGTASLF